MDAHGRPATAEAEIKYEVTAAEFNALPARLAALSFTPGVPEQLADHYLRYAPSPVHGWNLTRLRVRNGVEYLLTEKRWVRDEQGYPIRLEDERRITPEEGNALLTQAPDRVTLQKERREFHGMIDGFAATVVLDRLVLRGDLRYFVECETLTAPLDARTARETLIAWARDVLGLDIAREAPSMLELVLATRG